VGLVEEDTEKLIEDKEDECCLDAEVVKQKLVGTTNKRIHKQNGHLEGTNEEDHRVKCDFFVGCLGPHPMVHKHHYHYRANNQHSPL